MPSADGRRDNRGRPGASRGGRPRGGGDQSRRAAGERRAGSESRPSSDNRRRASGEGRSSGPRRTGDTAATRTAASNRGGERADLPPVPENVDPQLLDRDVRAELRSLAKPNAEAVARYLVAAGQAVDSDPARALAFARAARARAGRVAAVREAVGVAAYHAGEWTEALTELRTARRISGDPRNLALLADCERALGKPAQAVRYLSDPDVGKLDTASRLELLIVVAGARRDLGQLDAALAVLARGGLDRARPRPGSARLWYAYADALEAAGRTEDAASWFVAAAEQDPDDELDAGGRAAALL
jgi:tetratricopeptide (TPR) repeat protein